ncbi:MAG: hypothetical protein ACJA0N_001236 [Pseudohongiellaceae bacterium]|jgi:hypothetical protein
MSKAKLQPPRNGSRLTHYLTDLGLSNKMPSHKNFAERVGSTIGLPGSLILSNAPGKPNKTASHTLSKTTQKTIQESFLQHHSKLIQFISNCFDRSETRRRFQLPNINTEDFISNEKTLASYQRFYITLQTELSSKINALHSLISDAVSDTTAELNHLCTLDGTLGETLKTHQRKAYSSIAPFLATRFDYFKPLAASVDTPNQTNEFIIQFGEELKQLILTELDARLQATYGLIEALNEQVTTPND